MKPINICPVKVGQQVRHHPDGWGPTQWYTVLKIRVVGRGHWVLITTSGITHGWHSEWHVHHNNMCGMEVKNEAN